MPKEVDIPITASFIAGGFAGLTVDVTLFPLDTLKTRLQSAQGFLASGGFKNLYKGVGTAAVGSIPTASLFFCVYNTVKNESQNRIDPAYMPVVHMLAACIGEIGSCLMKVPIEVVKQRQQAAIERLPPLLVCRRAIASEGYLGLYRGFTTTVLREIPFALIQYPIWEWMKKIWRIHIGKELGVIEVAVCGAASGGIAAAVTTPLDVTKTRIMLAEKRSKSIGKQCELRTLPVLLSIYREGGLPGLFAGFIPRTLWITLGGAVFFGAYQAAVELCLSVEVLKVQ